MTVECRMTKSYIRTDEEEDTPVYGISFFKTGSKLLDTRRALASGDIISRRRADPLGTSPVFPVTSPKMALPISEMV